MTGAPWERTQIRSKAGGDHCLPVAQGTKEITVETLIAVRLGEEVVPREPIEILDRESRYFDEEE